MKQFTVLLMAMFTLHVHANSSLPDNRHIAVQGTSKIKAKPDLAIIHLEVQQTEQKSIDAKQNVDQRINALLAGLKKYKITEQDVSASSISTQSEYQYTVNNKQELIGYSARRTLKVTLKQLDKLNDFMDFALSVRINRINQVELKSSRAEQLKNEALTLAVNNAKQKGKALAAAFDAQLGKIYSINSTSEHHLYRYGQNSDIERISVTGSRLSQPAQPGKYLQENIVFSASINVVFDLTVE